MTDRPSMTRRGFGATAVAGLVGLGWGLGWRPALAEGPAPEDPWPILVQQIFGTKPVADDSGIVALDAPDRALDAATVPVTMRAGAKSGTQALRGLTLVIDQNPSPLAAKISLGAESGIDAISTRIRVNDYTNVHLVGELGDGTLHAVRHFVKAAGGCSAPMVKEEDSNILLGTMRLRQFPPAAGNASLREAQLIIRHPNNSGLQMDQLTRLYIPAHYITSVKIFQGDALLFAAETGISISQNPGFRFSFRPNGARQLRAEATDNKGGHFSGQWTAASA